MEFHSVSSAARLNRESAGRGAVLLAAWFGIAALLFTGEGIGQTRIAGKIADQTPPVASFEQVTSTTSGEPLTEISAPSAQAEEASLAKPSALLFLSAEAQNGGQSSSQSGTQSSSQDASAAAASTKAAAAKIKPPHHGLGIALAALGTTALVLGAVSYSLGHIDICSNEHSGGCGEARDAGLVLMPAGAAVAITGFYLQFHR
jgi:hypothetical protein